MGSVYNEIERVKNAKSDIETAIEECGVDVPDTELIDTYSTYVRQIPSAVFSSFNVDAVGGTDKYIQSIKQVNGLIETTVGGLVSTSSSGLVPKAGASSGIIDTQSTDWVLTNKNGTIDWYKLPESAYKNDKVTQTVTTTSNTSWRPLLLGYSYSDATPFAPTTVTNTVYASHLLKVQPSTGTINSASILPTTTNTYNLGTSTLQFNSIYGKTLYENGTSLTSKYASFNHPTSQITALTGYTKASEPADLVTTDTLNTALGKLETKADLGIVAYNWYKSVTEEDSDTVINKWDEIVGFIDSITEGTDVIDEFVTRKTNQQITGIKTFYTTRDVAPFNVASSTVVANLNADLLDGKHASDFALSTDIPTVTDYYWANVNIKDSADVTTTPIFGTITTSVCQIQSAGTGVVTIQSPDNLSKGASLNLPSITGLLICHTNDTAVGSTTNPVYIAATGLAIACTYSLNATVNSSTASPKLAYYSSTTEISAYTSSFGTVRRPIYLNAGVPTAITVSATTSTLYLVGVTSSTSSNHGFYSGTQTTAGVRIVSGNKLYAYGGFFESSDNRLKDFRESINVDLEKLSLLPKKYFTWKSDSDNKIQIGTSAQELQKLYPELVNEDEEGLLNVAYDKLSIIALAAIDKLHSEYKLKISILEKEIATLKESLLKIF